MEIVRPACLENEGEPAHDEQNTPVRSEFAERLLSRDRVVIARTTEEHYARWKWKKSILELEKACRNLNQGCEVANHLFKYTMPPSISFEKNIKFILNSDESLELKLRLDAHLDEQYSHLKFESSFFLTRISDTI